MRTLLVILAAGFILMLPGLASADHKKGTIELKEGFKNATKIDIGDKLKGECQWYINPNFFKKRVISVQCEIKNPTKAPLYYGYHVAFFDKEGHLIATSSMNGMSAVAPGKSTFVGNVISLPKHMMDRITNYQVTLFSEEKPFDQFSDSEKDK